MRLLLFDIDGTLIKGDQAGRLAMGAALLKTGGADYLAEQMGRYAQAEAMHRRALAVREKQVSPRELEHVNVDTTVQEKNITHPTDSKLYYKAILKLVDAAQRRLQEPNLNPKQRAYAQMAARNAERQLQQARDAHEANQITRQR